MKEKSFGEKWGKRTRNLGLVGAVIGILAAVEFIVPAGIALAAAGEIWSSSSEKSKEI